MRERAVSPDLRREYEHVLGRAVRGRGHDESLRRLLEGATVVEPGRTPRVLPDDPDDDKPVAAALAASADAIVTNDTRLLNLDPCGALRIMRPTSRGKQRVRTEWH